MLTDGSTPIAYHQAPTARCLPHQRPGNGPHRQTTARAAPAGMCSPA